MADGEVNNHQQTATEESSIQPVATESATTESTSTSSEVADGELNNHHQHDSATEEPSVQPGSVESTTAESASTSSAVAEGLYSLISSVITDFDSAAAATSRSQDQLSSSLDRLTAELDKLLEDAPSPFIMQHATKISGVRKRVKALNLVLKSIQRRIDNMDRMLSAGSAPGKLFSSFFLHLYFDSAISTSSIKKLAWRIPYTLYDSTSTHISICKCLHYPGLPKTSVCQPEIFAP